MVSPRKTPDQQPLTRPAPPAPIIPPARADTRSGFANGTQKAAEGTGGMVRVARGMGPAIRIPCQECPLRRDSAPGYLGGYTPEMYLEIMRGPASIACHRAKGFQAGVIETQRHCTGVAAFRANVGHVCSVAGVGMSSAQLSTSLVGEDRDVYFASDEEFVAHHKGAQA